MPPYLLNTKCKEERNLFRSTHGRNKTYQKAFRHGNRVDFFLAAGCAPFYFESTPPPAEPLRFASIEELPYREIWSGFVFNGEKVGFTHMSITQLPESQLSA